MHWQRSCLSLIFTGTCIISGQALADNTFVIQNNQNNVPVVTGARQPVNSAVSRRLNALQQFQEVEDELIELYIPEDPKALSREEIEQIVKETISNPNPLPPETEENEPETNPNFGKVGGIGGVGGIGNIGGIGTITTKEEDKP